MDASGTCNTEQGSILTDEDPYGPRSRCRHWVMVLRTLPGKIEFMGLLS